MKVDFNFLQRWEVTSFLYREIPNFVYEVFNKYCLNDFSALCAWVSNLIWNIYYYSAKFLNFFLYQKISSEGTSQVILFSSVHER